jgi:drug/metabolite transporter (DMT)-like permease
MAYSYLYPAFVLIIDVLLGHDLPKPAVLPGVLIVLSAMIVLQYPEKIR